MVARCDHAAGHAHRGLGTADDVVPLLMQARKTPSQGAGAYHAREEHLMQARYLVQGAVAHTCGSEVF